MAGRDRRGTAAAASRALTLGWNFLLSSYLAKDLDAAGIAREAAGTKVDFNGYCVSHSSLVAARDVSA